MRLTVQTGKEIVRIEVKDEVLVKNIVTLTKEEYRALYRAMTATGSSPEEGISVTMPVVK